jgi:hypothetical protein
MNSYNIPRRHRLVAPLQAYFKALGLPTPPVLEVPVPRLISLLDCEHYDGRKYVVVSKQVNTSVGWTNATYVLNVRLGRVYRAEHDCGMVTFWKGVARRRSEWVEYVAANGVVALSTHLEMHLPFQRPIDKFQLPPHAGAMAVAHSRAVC